MGKQLNVIWTATYQCNFACKYCYTDEEMSNKVDSVNLKMDLDLIELFFKKLATSSFSEFNFMFHGGEPLLLGLEYYREIVNFQKKYLKGEKYTNQFQTNGSLINYEVIRFLIENKFRVGISIDGPKEIHDLYRVSKNGEGTHDSILSNLRLLSEYNIPFGALVVCNDLIANSINETYSFFKSLKGLTTIDFIAPHHSAINNLAPNSFGNILINFFDSWFNDPDVSFDIRILSEMVIRLLGFPSSLCYFTESCPTQAFTLSIVPDGNVYHCNRNMTYSLGNIKNDEIYYLMYKNPIRTRLSKINYKQIESCRFCEWFPFCHGGCPIYFDQMANKSLYCLDFKNIFKHIYNTLERESILNNKTSLEICNTDLLINKVLKNRIKSFQGTKAKLDVI